MIGIIELGRRVIGFVLTLVYIIYSGIIFTQDVVGKAFTNINTKYTDSGDTELKKKELMKLLLNGMTNKRICLHILKKIMKILFILNILIMEIYI